MAATQHIDKSCDLLNYMIRGPLETPHQKIQSSRLGFESVHERLIYEGCKPNLSCIQM